jgi:hypothetical protein
MNGVPALTRSLDFLRAERSGTPSTEAPTGVRSSTFMAIEAHAWQARLSPTRAVTGQSPLSLAQRWTLGPGARDEEDLADCWESEDYLATVG